jgi:two-component system, OmpR family, sensor kinase
VGNPASFIRSAARGTSSAFRSLPIRWRLAGTSAVLTLVILCGFAAVVGTLTTRRIKSDFHAQLERSVRELGQSITIAGTDSHGAFICDPNFDTYASSEHAVIRLLRFNGDVLCQTKRAPDLGLPTKPTEERSGYRIETRPVDQLLPFGGTYVQYARRISDVNETVGRVRLFLLLGVLGGSGLALLSGLAISRRAMRPIAELTAAAKEIERTRDPGLKMPHVEADDEVAELAHTLESMLRALDSARGETESSLRRQREFVADASHELRTPLTSVLANLELLADELSGEQRDAAESALRSTRRMRRLVADLLLLARADTGRDAPHVPTDLAEVIVDVAAELEPVANGRELSLDIERTIVDGNRDELHRLVLNLMENALRHTPEGTAVEATVRTVDGHVELAVEDDGPGIAPELAEKVFERFVRGASDRGGSAGLGLAIVRAVVDSHGGTVALEDPLDGVGARFVVRLPATQPADTEPAPATSA